MAPPPAQPRRDRRLRDRRGLSRHGPLRAVGGAGGSAGRRSESPGWSLLPRAVGRASVRPRPAGPRRVLARRLRRALLAADRARRHGRRPQFRRLLRRPGRLLRRLGRLGDHARRRHHALDSGAPPRDRAGRDPRAGALADHGRRRGDADPDLRPAPSRLDPGGARSRLCARRALGRREGTVDPLGSHPPERDVARDRPGDSGPGDRDHRRGRPRLPRSRPAGSVHAGVGDDADRHDALPAVRAAPRAHPGSRDRDLGARLQPDRRRASRGPRPTVPGRA